MSDFECKVYHLEIEEHPNADAIELAKVGEYRSIVKKGEFETGDLAVYIPEAAIVPDWMLQKMGLEGRLAGKAKNRVKAIKLRGILSQGLVYPVEKGIFGTLDAGLLCKIGAEDYLVNIGDDVTEFLGITKYEPPIPVHMAGEVNNIGTQNTFNYDIENWRKYPDVLIEGEEVIFTEKIHGTFCVLGYNPNVGQPIVSSKGLFAKGLAFKMDTDRNDGNLYVKAFRSFETVGVPRFDLIDVARRDVFVDGQPFYLLGEVFGQGVQDLQYGATTPQVRIFDIYIGNPGEGEYLIHDGVTQVCAVLDLDIVPTLYRGPFSVEKMKRWTDGKETISGKETNIREGIVMNVAKERRDPELGRVVLKSVSEKYLLRKNKNATEYA
jgi:RNA ligase (TIGR02306 family)